MFNKSSAGDERRIFGKSSKVPGFSSRAILGSDLSLHSCQHRLEFSQTAYNGKHELANQRGVHSVEIDL